MYHIFCVLILRYKLFLYRYQTTKVKLLWWKGLPPSVRGNVWRLTIGNDLNITNGF